MKSFSTILALAAIVSFVFLAENGLTEDTEWWSYDKNDLPEYLPMKMIDKNDAEIRIAVLKVFKIQYDVITQHNGHSLDPVMPPIGYFNDEIPLTDVRTTNPETDIIFTNNDITGLVGNTNKVVIRWVSNEVVTKISWNELKLKGKYTFSNSTYFKQGQYLIKLLDVKYHAVTTLRENIQKYPSSVPKSSISYSDAEVSFSNGLPDITKPSDSSNVNYLLEEIVRQQLGDRVVQDAHKNATLAVWKVAKPFIVFKNYTDPFFPGVNGTLSDSAATKFVVDKFPISGLEDIRHQVKNVYVNMAANIVKIDLQLTAHYLNGYYNYRLGNDKENSTGSFTIRRMDFGVMFNVLDVASDCIAATNFVDPVNTYDTKGFGETDPGKLLTKVFFEHIKEELNDSYCKLLAKWYVKQI